MARINDIGQQMVEHTLHGDVDGVRRALELGANPNASAQGDDLGRNCAALTVAAEDGELEIVEALLAAGADPDGGVKETGERDCQDTPLVAALRNGHTEVAEMLVDAGANVACVCQDMHTALHYASQCSDGTELVPRLLALGANPNALNHLGSSPLHFACLSGSLEVVEALLEAEAQLEVRDDDGTPFDVAAQEGRIEIMRALAARGADVNTIGVDGENVLFDAVRRTDMEVVRECIRLGVNACAKDGSGCTLLHILAFEQHRSENEARSSSTESEIRRELVRLLAESGAGVNERDCELRTPMHVAVEQQNSAAALALLYAGSDLQLTNQNGLTALELARDMGAEEIVHLLTTH